MTNQMRNRLFVTLLAFGVAAAHSAAQEAPNGELPPAEIKKLVAPIALYPDVLVSQILPAATFPTDIVQAARWCKQHPDLKDLDKQKWDLSVLSVCRYSEILNKMDQDLDWTNALGSAFLDFPEDVMAAIQSLREEAADAGVLKTTAQQTVVTEEEVIRIVPTEKEVVYVPQYDPQVIYVDDGDDHDYTVVPGITSTAIGFTAGLALGAWLDNDCDWHGGCVIACRPGYWGGWGYHGVVSWDNDWIAARGPRRGVIAGEHGGAYVGPHGAAIWGDNGRGAAWRRPTTLGAPGYTGRYAKYNNVVGNRRNTAIGNNVTVNRNNVNIDRGDRTNVSSRNRTDVGRTNRSGDRPGQARPGSSNKSAFSGSANSSSRSRESNRGAASRTNSSQHKPAAARPTPSRQSSSSSAFNSSRSASSTRSASHRGAASRGGGRAGGRGGRR